jgi:zinc finger protein
LFLIITLRITVALEEGSCKISTGSNQCRGNLRFVEMDNGDMNLLHHDVATFPTPCPRCRLEAETKMCMVNIPHFKEVIIMNLQCEGCGYKSTEIKGGGGISKFGTRITLHVNHTDDLSRDVIKSDTAGITIPQLKLKLEEGGMGGMYTTVEGLLNKLHDRLQTANPFASVNAVKKQHMVNDDGDTFSPPSECHAQYSEFLKKLKGCADGRRFPFTLVISDPLSNSFVGPRAEAIARSSQAEKDDNSSRSDKHVYQGIDLEEYERSHEQNESLGLNDIKTENY